MDKPLSEVRQGILENLCDVYRDSEATGYFLAILLDQIKPYYPKVHFEAPGIIECLIGPAYGDLQEKDKTIVRVYFDRKVEIFDDNQKLKEICNRMASLSNGNFRIYSKGELKYLY